MTTPRHQRTAAFVTVIEQEWSEYYFDFMTTNPHVLEHYDDEDFASNCNITMKTIETHPDYEWNDDGILNNPNLTWDFLKRYKDGKYSTNVAAIKMFSMKSTYYAKDYREHADLMEFGIKPRERVAVPNGRVLVPDEPNWWQLSPFYNLEYYKNEELLPDSIKDMQSSVYLKYASMNPNMTITLLKSFYNSGKLIKRSSLLLNPIVNGVFTFDDIDANPDIPWDYDSFGENPSLRFDFIAANRTIIDGYEYLYNIYWNAFVAEKSAYLERRRREYMAAYQIQQWWLRTTSDPRNVVCIRRLERDFAKFFPDK